MGILKFEDYTINSSILSLIKEFENIDINESSNNNHLNDIVNTLNLNENIIDIYNSVNFDVLFNIVKELISNDSLNVELSDKNITQSTLSLILISLKNDIEKTNNLKYYNSVDDLKNDIRDILEELKLEGIGNGIIKKNCKTKAGRNYSKHGDYRLYWVISGKIRICNAQGTL